ncbi:hypothetical protein HRbin27_01473 [bacterium HR27]|nr:hypothetical protein HRbin27_01473 [bacterium HR27]
MRLFTIGWIITLLVAGTVLQTQAAPRWWQPQGQLRWHIQFTGPLRIPRNAHVVILDLFETDPATIRSLHRQGKRVVCYLNAGAWEDWRPDAGAYPPQLLGNDYDGWSGERWVDIRRIDLLGPLLEARLDLCRAKGFDGVDPDNMNGFQNDTGFPLTQTDQLRFNRWLAAEAHARGLAIGLKNDAEQARLLVGDFDWILVESCSAQGWCDLTAPFRQARKPILALEYVEDGMTKSRLCTVAQQYGLSAQIKRRQLDAWSQPCWS